MSGVSLPVSRPTGRALIVANPACRSEPLSTLQRLGFQCAEVDDPYWAMMELCRRPLVYRALVLSLAGIYREELTLISAVKRRFPHVEIWLTHTDGRQASLAEAMRFGADGLVGEDGLHRTSLGSVITDVSSVAAHTASTPPPQPPPAPLASPVAMDSLDGEAVLTAEELRALLQEQPILPQGDARDE